MVKGFKERALEIFRCYKYSGNLQELETFIDQELEEHEKSVVVPIDIPDKAKVLLTEYCLENDLTPSELIVLIVRYYQERNGERE